MKELLAQLYSLIPVAVGALIALMGGAIKLWSDRREAKRQRRREKLERLLTLVYSLKPWSDSLDSFHAFGLTDAELPSPIEEIEVLGNIYFYELHAEIEAVAKAAKLYKSAMLRLSAARTSSGAIDPNTEKKIAEVHDPLLKAIQAFTARAREVAKKSD